MKINAQLSTNANRLSNNLNAINKRQENNMKKMSSGKKINSAKDDPAGLAISDNLENLVKGLEKANQNILNSNSALNIADGALQSIGDSLQRIKELGTVAGSSLLNDDDRQMIQEEINEMLKGIDDISKNTQFNGKNLLDGNFKDFNVANTPNGTDTEISIDSATLDALQISGFSVTDGKIDLSKIDKALDLVNSSRAKIGANSNRLDYGFNSNSNTALNTISTNSKIKDADMAKLSIDKNMNKALAQYNIFVAKNKQNKQANMLNLLF